MSPILRMIVPTIGLMGMAAMAFLYFASGLLVSDAWAVFVLCVLWFVMAVLSVLWFKKRPWLVLAMPVIAYAIWVIALTLGEHFLGWTA